MFGRHEAEDALTKAYSGLVHAMLAVPSPSASLHRIQGFFAVDNTVRRAVVFRSGAELLASICVHLLWLHLLAVSFPFLAPPLVLHWWDV